MYYSFTNFATGRDEPKATYVKSIDWNGTPAGIGAGIYQRDIPGSCNREEVNAAALALRRAGARDGLRVQPARFDRVASLGDDTEGYTAFGHVLDQVAPPRAGLGLRDYAFGTAGLDLDVGAGQRNGIGAVLLEYRARQEGGAPGRLG